jgi:hypothetical protein
MTGAEMDQVQKKGRSWTAMIVVFSGVGLLRSLELAFYCFGPLGSASGYETH